MLSLLVLFSLRARSHRLGASLFSCCPVDVCPGERGKNYDDGRGRRRRSAVRHAPFVDWTHVFWSVVYWMECTMDRTVRSPSSCSPTPVTNAALLGRMHGDAGA